jgi:PAS domain S-box-containing protein
MLALSVVGWGVAYTSSMQLTRGRMMSSADLAAESLPNALDTGQSLIQIYLADERLADPDPDTARTVLREKLDTGLYFAELMLVEPDGSVLVEEAAAPGSADALSAAESSGVVLAAEGVPFQYYSSGAPEGGAPIVISFIAPVPGSGRVLVGRSLLAGNPFISPLLESVHNLSDIQGQGLLVDEAGLILHHPVPQMVGTGYGGALKAEGGFSTSATPDGQPALVYAVPVDGRSWMVVVEVPMSAVQIRALRLAAPFVGLLAALAVGSLVTLRVILSVVTGSLRTLAVEAAEIGEKRARLATPIESSGVDEVGRMRAAFERMRASLNARMVEQEQLLRASHGAASSLDFNQAVRPILAAALSGGAESARVVLSQGTLPDSDANQPGTFGAGPKNARFAYLDGQVLRILENEDRLVTRNPIGHPGLNFENGRDIPSGLAGLPLRHDQDYFGVIWLGYSGRHTFSDDEVVFLSTLAAQASLAVANTRLFRSAEVERERLAAILASTPDPIIVTDRDNRLFHANLAAEQVLGERLKTGRRQPIETLIDHPGLIELICSDPVEPRSIEVGPETGGTYVAKVTAFVFRGERIGKVCILRDITRYKELDTLKSELVSNVGHDLDQPLQIILGYTTMLPIVGPMSAEQQVYVNKISLGVQRVKEMVNNLVSMGKIEAGVGLTMVALSLVDLTIQTLRERQTQASQKRVHLTIVPPAERIPDIFGDEVLILRAIGNLVDNAIKYSNNDGSVRISFSVRQAGSVVRMSIDDQGIGIALPDQDRLFERFYRSANPETRKRHGTGLGLAIVRSIVEAHGGRVWFESTPGRGSSFHIELPAVHQGSDG